MPSATTGLTQPGVRSARLFGTSTSVRSESSKDGTYQTTCARAPSRARPRAALPFSASRSLVNRAAPSTIARRRPASSEISTAAPSASPKQAVTPEAGRKSCPGSIVPTCAKAGTSQSAPTVGGADGKA